SRDTGESQAVTEPVLHDSEPSFDPDGKYLYFIGQRELNPVYDSLHFDLGFPKGSRPYLLTLRADTPSPFVPVPKPLQEEKKKDQKSTENGDGESQSTEPTPVPDAIDRPVKIDFDGIARRVVAFPVAEGIYAQIAGIPGKALFSQ